MAPALAALCYVVVPEAWLAALCDALFRPGGRERAAREEASRALNALSAAFGELAAGVANLPDEQAVLVDMRKRLCAQCSGYDVAGPEMTGAPCGNVPLDCGRRGAGRSV